MKKLGILLVSLFALGLFAIPALGAADPVDVSINVPKLSSMDGGADVTLIPDSDDLDNTYVFALNDSTMVLKGNSAWTATAQLDTAYTSYSLWVEDTQTSGNSDGTGFVSIVHTGATALSSFADYGGVGSHTYNLDWLATGLAWTIAPSDQTKTVTFTVTCT